MNKKLLIALVAVVLLGAGYQVVHAALSSGSVGVLLDDNRNPAKDGASCITNIVAPSTVGHQLSSTILAASSSRAYARIQRVVDGAGVATSGPVSVSFDEGAAATITGGIALSTSTPFIEFGLATTFPYTGAVTGITTAASTTVQVTVCTY